MFEAFVTLCALQAGEVCREALLPGYANADQAACETAAAEAATTLDGLGAAGDPYCAARPASTLGFEEIAPGIHVHRGAIAEPDRENLGDVSNIAFVVGEEAVAVIDAGSTRALGEATYLAVREVSEKPIRYLILTHMHPDHVLGAAPISEAGARIVAHPRLPRSLADRSQTYLDRFADLIGQPGFLGTDVPAIDAVTVFETSLDLGGRTLNLVPRETAHTNNDMTVFDTESGILFAGDLVFDEHLPTLDGLLRGWIALLREMCEERADGVVPGHGGPVLYWPEGAAPMLGYLETLVADTRAEIDAGTPLSEAVGRIGQGQAEKWSLFDLYNPRNATIAYTELEWE